MSVMEIDEALDLGVGLGEEIGISRWFDVTQEAINEFGHCTEDMDIAHIDPEWATAKGPFGQAIAFGFWTLSMMTAMNEDIGLFHRVMANYKNAYPINYGVNKVRFISQVPVGKRIRMKSSLKNVERKGEASHLITIMCEIEIEGEPRLALAADWLFVLVLKN